jgi:hypothetical protein
MQRISLLALVVVTGCFENLGYYYAPEGATVARGGVPAQISKVPPEEPQGEVVVASQGLVHLRGSDGRRFVALNVRMIVDNEGNDVPWLVDTREQLVEISGLGRSRPLFSNADVSGLPIVAVPRRTKHTIDFYFPAPASSPGQLPAFDFLWQVVTPKRTVSERDHFRRMEIEPLYAYNSYYWNAWGPYWWYDPLWPSIVYVHEQPVVVRAGPEVQLYRY